LAAWAVAGRHDGGMSENPYAPPPDPGQPAQPDPSLAPGQPIPAPPTEAVSYAPTTVPTESLAIWALICAIGAWVLLPVILAIVALVLARSADEEISKAAGWKQGKGLVSAARVSAWLHLLLAALVVVFVVTFFIGLAIGG
jgi:hypothetical protein